MPTSRIIVPLDYPTQRLAEAFVARVSPQECALKVGKELFTAAGPALVARLAAQGFRVFLDLKYHDIPNTVAQACKAAADLGVWMLNVHASGGRAMLTAAREAIAGTAQRPLLIAVTVLTSLDDQALRELGIAEGAAAHAARLAGLARDCGLDGVVCSAWEAGAVKAAHGAGFLAVTPGIRLAEGNAHDQARVATPEAAVRAGADYLVIGRAITQAADPHATLAGINKSIGTRA
ncbi:MAG: orotidine-5'-phosphate decarboxylase [Betaproteobacteria bacterium]|nr:orotidine-5'-phosphate decarboxylase [Betaproteobacteria bacterium]